MPEQTFAIAETAFPQGLPIQPSYTSNKRNHEDEEFADRMAIKVCDVEAPTKYVEVMLPP